MPMILKAVCLFSILSLNVFAFQREPSMELRAKLFKQLLVDYPDVRECLAEQEGGVSAAEKNLTVEERDLNRDGVKEYEVQLSGICSCGAHNCSIYLYRRSGQEFESILDNASGLGLKLLRTFTKGYVDLRIDAHNSAASQSRTIYKFDGKEYRETQTTIVNLQTGESKPAFRRVQFKRGASSTTVQGRASIALPDTYLIRATAGQTMSVQLTSARKSVRFLVMSPKTTSLIADNTRSWTGTLPETGDYHIIVDVDDRGATYSMTITIK